MDKHKLLQEAQKQLSDNWTGEYTVAAPGLYPHHWGWDTPINALAYSYFNLDRAMQEMQHQLDAQWDNGFIPHIIFAPGETSYFPGPDFYQSKRSPDAPDHVETSGITQPPTQALGLYYIKRNSGARDVDNWVEPAYEQILHYHEHLMDVRDPEDSGALTIFHPWECMDDLPVWDEAIVAMNLEDKDIPDYERKDLAHIDDPIERPPDIFYDCYVYLIDQMRKKNYNFREIYEDHPFKFKDVAFTSIFYAANRYLKVVGETLSRDTSQIEDWQTLIRGNFEDNFKTDPNSQLYFSYDLINQHRVQKDTVVSLLPLFGKVIEQEQADYLIEKMRRFFMYNQEETLPMVPTTSDQTDEFAHQTYWRGPVWAMTTWFVYRGLVYYGEYHLADRIKHGFLELVDQSGFWEYYSPKTGEGHGIHDFAWTATIVIDMIEGSRY